MVTAELEGIEDLETAEAVVRDVRDRTIGVDLESLRQTLHAQNLMTTTQTLGMQISVGAGIAGIAVSLSGMPILGLGIAATAQVGQLAATLAAAQGNARASPATYLLDIEKRARGRSGRLF